jgi:phosphotransferase system HPr (HPr) family protein
VPPSSERTAVLPDNVPLHARPAGLFVRAAAQFGSDVAVAANGKRANAKSILEVLALGAEGGTVLTVSASGDDAADAVDQLATLVAQLA